MAKHYERMSYYSPSFGCSASQHLVVPVCLPVRVITQFWQDKLRASADRLKDSSLCYFNPDFMSLVKPHPIWTTCGANSYETKQSMHSSQISFGEI